METLNLKEAQAIATIASRMDRKPGRRKVTALHLLDTIKHLGMVQLDTISVVTRAHETALFSRLGPYSLELWQELFSDRKITEYLTHAAAIVPAEDIPLMREMMRRIRERADRWVDDPQLSELAQLVLERIDAEGPLTSRHFDNPPPEKQGAWASWYGPKKERRVLADLWAGGELLIARRDPSFTRWYDLAHRIYDMAHLEEEPAEDLSEQLALRSLKALGITNANWLCDYYRTGGRRYISHSQAQQLLRKLSKQGDCVPVSVQGVTGPLYLYREYLEALDGLRAGRGWPSHTTFLSPFDNLIFNRRRMRELFLMDYTIEIYTPSHQRTYGYYTMPILHKGELIGRIDPVLNRRTRQLTIRQVTMEAGVKPGKALNQALTGAFDSFAQFIGAEQWQIENSGPAEWDFLTKL